MGVLLVYQRHDLTIAVMRMKQNIDGAHQADLAIHLACTQAVPRSPLILPRSQLHFGLWVEYLRLFPYEEQAIIDLAQAVMLLARFMDFRPFKGYFDLGFTCEANAATAATVPLVFNGTPIPTTRTWLPHWHHYGSPVCRVAHPPPPAVLHQELMEGFAAYGSNHILKFVVPNGAARLAGP
ncbi:hypothetical protein L0F63_003806 [Massospora cicadina]|nr:hypothetical protein L0F63_003806 [Massospora cicadina]